MDKGEPEVNGQRDRSDGQREMERNRSSLSLANWWPCSLDRAGLRQSLRKSGQKSARQEAELLERT